MIFTNILMMFGIKKNLYFDPYNVFLAIATNIPQRLKTGFVSRVTNMNDTVVIDSINYSTEAIKYIFCLILW